MSEPTNADRARVAMIAVEAFRSTNFPEGILEQDIRDLVTNLCHLYRRECIGKQCETAPSDTITGMLLRSGNMHDIEVDECEEGNE